MATGTLQTTSTSVGELQDMPIDPSWIKEGNPVARGTVVSQSEDTVSYTHLTLPTILLV